jgi:uncharacterized membrane protein
MPAEPHASTASATGVPRAARRRRELHRWFDAGVVFKGAEGLLEIVAGAWFAFDPSVLHTLVFRLTAKELLHDPEDRIANFLRDMAEHLGSGPHTFAVVYLVAHGVVKVALAAGLLTHRRWAFPFALVTLVAFAVYQLYRYTHTHSLALPLLAALDLAIAWLVWREGRFRKDDVVAA